MAVLRIHFFSQCLQRNVDFNMFLPNDPREGQKEPVIKTGFFLHGYTGSAEDFWELTELAEKYHFSVGYLSRMIKKETGYSFSEILNSIRLTAAVELLADETIKISHIGDRVGFSDQKYFSQVFKKTFGMSPGEYRKQKEIPKYCIMDILKKETEEK